jgi:hypothetical protein
MISGIAVYDYWTLSFIAGLLLRYGRDTKSQGTATVFA